MHGCELLITNEKAPLAAFYLGTGYIEEFSVRNGAWWDGYFNNLLSNVVGAETAFFYDSLECVCPHIPDQCSR